MTRPTVLVTGATGKTGAAVVDELLAREFPVRALVRRRDARADALGRRGADVVVADVFDPDQVLGAMRGADRAYFVPVFHPTTIQSAVVFRLAAQQARLEAVVHLTQWLSHRAHPAAMTRQSWLIDQLFADLPDMAHTVVNPGLFADNFLRTIDLAALLGVYPVLTGEGRAAVVSNEDIARVVTAVLTAPDPGVHAGRAYRPTGPALLTGREMGEIIARVVGHRVRSVDLPFSMFSKMARRQRVNPLEVSGFRHYAEEMRRGAFSLGGGVTHVVEYLTGTPAESFEVTARRYSALPFAQQTTANRVRAAIEVAAVPFRRGYDLDRLDQEMQIQAPSAPSLSIDDDRWRAEHENLMTQDSGAR